MRARLRFVILIAIAVGLPGVARAWGEDEPGAARIERRGSALILEGPSTSTVARAPTHCGAEVDGLYEEAFDMLAMGERSEASLRLARILEMCPDHPYAGELRRLAEAARELAPSRGELRPPKRIVDRGFQEAEPLAPPEQVTRAETSRPEPGGEEASLLARGELVTIQTLHGLAEGLLLCAALSCDDARVAVSLGFAGVALGGGASFFLSKGIRPGQALAVNSGMGWGLWNSIAFANLLGAEDEQAAALYIGGTLAGTALGSAVAVFGVPRSGQVSLANSGGLWAGTLALWLMDFAQLELFEKTFFEVELVATNLGLGAGALLSRNFPMSRGRVLLIDAGGIVGMLLGVGTSVLIDSEPSPRLLGGLGFIGTLAGLASTAYLSRGLDEPEPPSPGLTLLPLGPRGSLGASVALEF